MGPPPAGLNLSTDQCPASSQNEFLIRSGHLDSRVGKACSELPHGVFFAVNEKRARRAGLLSPSQQLRLVGMGGETVDGVDASPNRNILAENAHLFGAVDNI